MGVYKCLKGDNLKMQKVIYRNYLTGIIFLSVLCVTGCSGKRAEMELALKAPLTRTLTKETYKFTNIQLFPAINIYRLPEKWEISQESINGNEDGGVFFIEDIDTFCDVRVIYEPATQQLVTIDNISRATSTFAFDETIEWERKFCENFKKKFPSDLALLNSGIKLTPGDQTKGGKVLTNSELFEVALAGIIGNECGRHVPTRMIHNNLTAFLNLNYNDRFKAIVANLYVFEGNSDKPYLFRLVFKTIADKDASFQKQKVFNLAASFFDCLQYKPWKSSDK